MVFFLGENLAPFKTGTETSLNTILLCSMNCLVQQYHNSKYSWKNMHLKCFKLVSSGQMNNS